MYTNDANAMIRIAHENTVTRNRPRGATPKGMAQREAKAEMKKWDAMNSNAILLSTGLVAGITLGMIFFKYLV